MFWKVLNSQTGVQVNERRQNPDAGAAGFSEENVREVGDGGEEKCLSLK